MVSRIIQDFPHLSCKAFEPPEVQSENHTVALRNRSGSVTVKGTDQSWGVGGLGVVRISDQFEGKTCYHKRFVIIKLIMIRLRNGCRWFDDLNLPFFCDHDQSDSMYSDAWESWCSMIYHDSQVIRVKLVTSHSAGPKVEGAQWPAWQPDTDDAWPGAGSNGWFAELQGIEISNIWRTSKRSLFYYVITGFHQNIDHFWRSLVGYGSKSFANLRAFEKHRFRDDFDQNAPFQRFLTVFLLQSCFGMVKSHLSPIFDAWNPPKMGRNSHGLWILQADVVAHTSANLAKNNEVWSILITKNPRSPLRDGILREFQLWEVRPDTMQVLWLNAQYSHFWSVYHLVLPSDQREDDADLCHDPDILWWKPWVTEQLSLGVSIPRAEVALV